MEKINVAELLKGCPKGMELYSPLCGDCKLYDVNDYNIRIETPNKDTLISLYHDGRYCSGGEIMIFPKGKTTWEGFVPPCQFKNGDIIYIKCKYYDWCSIFYKCEDGKLYTYADICFSSNNFYCSKPNIICECSDIIEHRLATEEEKEKLFDGIKAKGYKWNEETKTLEKLAPNKFDINTLKPFESRVLVRDYKEHKWTPAIWGFYDNDHAMNYPYECIGDAFAQCIPYEGNEHLLGTNNECNEYYKTWK